MRWGALIQENDLMDAFQTAVAMKLESHFVWLLYSELKDRKSEGLAEILAHPDMESYAHLFVG